MTPGWYFAQKPNTQTVAVFVSTSGLVWNGDEAKKVKDFNNYVWICSFKETGQKVSDRKERPCPTS